jgi:hypothetical protein
LTGRGTLVGQAIASALRTLRLASAILRGQTAQHRRWPQPMQGFAMSAEGKQVLTQMNANQQE